jgi:DNA-binding SARP family transcriptional activator/Tfp pilus assembly protein PilF
MASADIHYGLLGPVTAWRAGRELDLGWTRQRYVLAILLLENNRTVSVDGLVDAVWGEQPPNNARRTLQTNISRLRSALDPDTRTSTLVTTAGGYLLRCDPDNLDDTTFERRVAAADDHHRAGDLAGAATEIDAALALWRGEPFSGLSGIRIDAERADRYERHRLALELRASIQLDRGAHDTALAGLISLVDQFPLRERLRELLMIALYRAGRQADALGQYNAIRERLADELGVDPSPSLRQLHQRILTNDSALWLVSPRTPGQVTVAVPRQSPAPPPLFTGRGAALAELSESLRPRRDTSTGMPVVAIAGTAGVGKTSLALHWAHQHADEFPDGQLFANLRGFDAVATPTEPSTVLRGFLDSLGVDPPAIPPDQDGRTALFRSLVADRRVLIILDDAADTAQVTPLLPGSTTCAVLVTGRRRLTGLAVTGARLYDLDVLPDAEARGVLATRLGERRLATDTDATRALLAACAGLPLALSVIAARAATHPHFPLATLASQLRDATTRMDALDAGELSANVRAAFDSSYRAFDADTATMFGLLGLAPGVDISLAAAASLAGQAPSRVRTLLRGLETASVLHQPQPDRYRMHDLLRLYAAEQAQRNLSDGDTTAAVRRVVGYYVHTAFAGNERFWPLHAPADIGPPPPGCRPEPLADQRAALRWFMTEHANLLAARDLAAARGWHDDVYLLARTTDSFHIQQGHSDVRLTTWLAALSAVQHLDDPVKRSHVHEFLGHAYAQAGRYTMARGHLDRALGLAERTGDRLALCCTEQAIAWLYATQGDHRLGLRHALRALRYRDAVANPRVVANALNSAGWEYAALGELDQARQACESALTLARENNNPHMEATVLDSLGFVAQREGKPSLAVDYYHRALVQRRHSGHLFGEANSLAGLGDAHVSRGEYTQARDVWLRALELFRRQHRFAEADRVQRQLDLLLGVSV